MNVENLVEKVPLVWREEFVQFVQSGEASEAFLNFLDESPDCQEAVEEAFTAQAAAFERFAAHLHAPAPAGPEAAFPSRDVSPEHLSVELARTMSAASELPNEARRQVAERAAEVIRSGAVGIGQGVRTLVVQLEKALDKRMPV